MLFISLFVVNKTNPFPGLTAPFPLFSNLSNSDEVGVV